MAQRPHKVSGPSQDTCGLRAKRPLFPVKCSPSHPASALGETLSAGSGEDVGLSWVGGCNPSSPRRPASSPPWFQEACQFSRSCLSNLAGHTFCTEFNQLVSYDTFDFIVSVIFFLILSFSGSSVFWAFFLARLLICGHCSFALIYKFCVWPCGPPSSLSTCSPAGRCLPAVTLAF